MSNNAIDVFSAKKIKLPKIPIPLMTIPIIDNTLSCFKILFS